MDTLKVQEFEISIKDNCYYSLTDIAKNLSNRPPNELVKSWIRNQRTMVYLEAWEKLNNPKQGKSTLFKIEDIRNDRSLTVKEYNRRGGIGIFSNGGRYGGTYAHIEIAFEFTTWLSPEFKVLFFKEWVRMKDSELLKNDGIEWTLKKLLSNSLENQILIESINEVLLKKGNN